MASLTALVGLDVPLSSTGQQGQCTPLTTMDRSPPGLILTIASTMPTTVTGQITMWIQCRLMMTTMYRGHVTPRATYTFEGNLYI